MFVLQKKLGEQKNSKKRQKCKVPPSKPPANQIFRDILASQGHSIMLSKLAPPLIRRFTAGKFKLALRALRVKHICKICAKVGTKYGEDRKLRQGAGGYRRQILTKCKK